MILGATGVAGTLAVQTAKLLGAGRVIAAGRNERSLAALGELGADATLRVDRPEHELVEAFAAEARDGGFDVVIDYLWGRPTEALIAAISQRGLTHHARRVRLVDVGDSAGPTLSLPAAVLRSSALEIYGSGPGTIPLTTIIQAVPQFIEVLARGELRLEAVPVPLEEIGDAWEGGERHGGRLVVWLGTT